MSKKRLEEIKKVRRGRIKELRDMGINPYPSKVPEKRITIKEALDKKGSKVSVSGRVWGIREHGSCCFFDLKEKNLLHQQLFHQPEF
ncbi:hypothetical protein ACFL0F_00640 [Patescibacteria group bacterium]